MPRTETNPSADRLQRFRFLLQQFSLWANAEGLPVEPFSSNPVQPLWFSTLPEPQQESTFRHFERYFQAVKDTLASGVSMREDSQLLWRMFQKLSVRPRSDLMDRIAEGDVIEIYNSDFVQVFRNLEFFRICSYTLDDLLCRPFWDLYQRDEKLTATLVESLKEVFSGKNLGTQPWVKPQHAVQEIQSRACYRTTVDLKFLSPLHDPQGQVTAVVSTFKVVSCVPTALGRAQPAAQREDRG